MLNRHLTRLIAIGLLLTIGMLDCHRARSADTADGRSAERPVVEWRFEEDTNPEVPGPRPPL